MEYIHKLPFILGCIMALITGIISLNSNLSTEQIYLRMIFSLVIFFALGTFLRNMILEIRRDTLTKKAVEILEKQSINEMESKSKEEETMDADKILSTLDILVDDENDDFKLLNVKEIKSAERK